MTKKRILLIALAIVGILSLSVASFGLGVVYTLQHFNIDILATPEYKYVTLNDAYVIKGRDTVPEIELPKGTLLFYEKSFKGIRSQACLRINEDKYLFEERVTEVSVPGTYHLELPKEAREKYKGP